MCNTIFTESMNNGISSNNSANTRNKNWGKGVLWKCLL